MGDKLKDKSYRLADDRSGESFMLKVGRKGNLTIFDEEEKVRKAIRHCPNQRSVFRDEQDDYAEVSPIIFVNGYLKVASTEPITQKFLDLHPSNVLNGGQWFEAVDDELEAKESIELDEIKIDLKYLVRQKAKEEDGIHALKAEVAVVLNSVDEAGSKGIEELKQILYNEIEADPFYFTDDSNNPVIFDNDEITRKYIVLKSIKDGVIRKSPNNKSIIWSKNKEVIATAPLGIDLVDYFTSFLSTDEGMLVLEEITRRS
jgi:hypothetical protein